MIRHPLTILYFLLLLVAVSVPTQLLAQHTKEYKYPDKYFKLGNELMQKKNYGAAQRNFKIFLQKGTTHHLDQEKLIDAEYNLAYIALVLEQSDAQARYQEFIKKYPRHPKAIQAHYAWGNYYYEKKDYMTALEYLEKVNNEEARKVISDSEIKLEFRLGKAYFELGKYDKALEYLDKIKDADHEYSHPANYYAGYIRYKQKQYNQSIIDLNAAAESSDYQKAVPILIATNYYAQEQYAQVISYTDSLFNRNENVDEIVTLYLLAAESAYYSGQFDKAMSYFNRHLGLLSKAPPAEVAYKIAFTHYKLKNYKLAAESFKSIADQENEMGQKAAYYLGICYIKMGNKRFAATSFDQVRKMHFDATLESSATWTLGKLQYDLGQYNESIATLEEFVQSYPQADERRDAEVLLTKAYMHSKEYSKAMVYIEQLPKRNDEIQVAYQQIAYAKGVEYFNTEAYDQAIEMFKKSLQNVKLPKLGYIARFWIAESYALNQRSQESIPYYQQVIGAFETQDKYSLLASYGLGYAYYNQRSYATALPYFRKCVNFWQLRTSAEAETIPYSDAVTRLADCYYVQKEYPTSLRYYNEIIAQKYPEQDYAYYQQGMIWVAQGKYTQAKQNFDLITKNYPNSRYYDQALYEKAVIDLENGNNSVAIAEFSSLMKERPRSLLKPDALLKRALAYQNIQNKDEAINDYKTILKDHPAHSSAPSALLSLQELLSESGRMNELNAVLSNYKKVNPNSQALLTVDLRKAEQAFFDGEYKKAIQLFKDYIQKYPEGGSPNAKYYLGESYLSINDKPNALRYHMLVVQEQKSTYMERSMRRVGDLLYAQEKYRPAIDAYQLLASVTKSSRNQIKAWEGLMNTYYEIKKLDSARYFANEIITKGNSELAKNKAMLYVAQSYYDQNDYVKALPLFKKVSESAKDKSGAIALYSYGHVLYNQGLYKESLDALFRLNKEFPMDDDLRGKNFLLIADNYIGLKEYFQAKATLNSIIARSPNRNVVTEARKKLQDLKEKEKVK
ncbi:MAG TPA: hypothetical protein DCS93_15870 [Microscillaceae bacterium]|nr:hypothetical protein [Microscillaceae bacterium]